MVETTEDDLISLFSPNQLKATVRTPRCVLWKWASRVTNGGKSSTKASHFSSSCRNNLMGLVASRNHCSWQSLFWMIPVLVSSFKWGSFSAPRQANKMLHWMTLPNHLDFYCGFCLIFRHREINATRASANTSVPTASKPVTWWVVQGRVCSRIKHLCDGL